MFVMDFKYDFIFFTCQPGWNRATASVQTEISQHLYCIGCHQSQPATIVNALHTVITQ